MPFLNIKSPDRGYSVRFSNLEYRCWVSFLLRDKLASEILVQVGPQIQPLAALMPGANWMFTKSPLYRTLPRF